MNKLIPLAPFLLMGCVSTQTTYTQTKKIVAPVDSYVCFTSQSDCTLSPLPKRWGEYYSSQRELFKVEEVYDIRAFPINKNLLVELSDITKDTEDLCGNIQNFAIYNDNENLIDSPFKESIKDRHNKACVVFYSPVLISQWAEEKIKLNYAVNACNRVKKAIKMQIDMMSISEEVANPSLLSDEILLKANATSYENQKVLTKQEREDVINYRNNTIRGKERIRQVSHNHKMKVELQEQMNDAVLKVTLAENAVNRTRFYMDEVRFQSCDEGEETRNFTNGSWVTKGVEVLTIEY